MYEVGMIRRVRWWWCSRDHQTLLGAKRYKRQDTDMVTGLCQQPVAHERVYRVFQQSQIVWSSGPHGYKITHAPCHIYFTFSHKWLNIELEKNLSEHDKELTVLSFWATLSSLCFVRLDHETNLSATGSFRCEHVSLVHFHASFLSIKPDASKIHCSSCIKTNSSE